MACAVPGCDYGSQSDVALIRFPENESLRSRWREAIGFGCGLLAHCSPSDEDTSCDLAICSSHFADKSFSDYQEPSLFTSCYGELSEVCSCRICLQFYHRSEMLSKDSRFSKKTVSCLVKKVLGLTLTDKDFLMLICEECLVKLDICVSLMKNAKKAGARFKELAMSADNEKIVFLEPDDTKIELCEDQEMCVDEFVETIRIDPEGNKFIAFEVDLIPSPDESMRQSGMEFVAVASDETDMFQSEQETPKSLRKRGPGRARKQPKVPVAEQKQSFKDILSRKCYICNTLLACNNDLIGHLTTHAANADYRCEECGDRRFNKVTSYNHHLSFHDLDNRPLKCDLCKLGFSTVPSLKTHQNREHGATHVLCKPKRRMTGRCYQCDTCGKTFRGCYQLREHDDYYHKKIFTSVCTVCGKAFPTRSLLLKHYIVHSGEKPYKCDWCGEAYKNSTCLDNHVLKHKNGRLKGKRKN